MRFKKTFLGNKNSEKLLVVFHGWGGNSFYLRLSLKPFFKNYSFLFYDYSADILNPDPFSILKNFQTIKKDFYNQLEIFSEKKIILFGTSLGSFLSTYLANIPQGSNLERLLLNTIGSKISETFWYGKATQKLKREMLKKGITLEDLKEMWEEIEPKNNIPQRENLRYLVFLSKKEKVIPFYLCEEFLKLLEGKPAEIYFNKYLGHLGACMFNNFRIKKIKKFLEK
ncbi:MAG: alpha/beta hydrolase [Candidatus Pacebacteria bacterium]|nr:alpha/beta hydrolase [Candidatus Paceibacterota bacterium]